MIAPHVVALNRAGVASPGLVPPTNGFVHATVDSSESAQALHVRSPRLTPHSATPVAFAFHTGRRPSPHRPVYEYTRQLNAQMRALSVLTVQEYLDGRATFNKLGRKATPAWVTTDRRIFSARVADRLMRKHKIGFDKAHILANRAVKALAALHNPDQGLGGPRDPSRGFGGQRVNASVGPQNRNLAEVLDRVAGTVPQHLCTTTGFNLLILLASYRLARKINRVGGTVVVPPGQTPRPPSWLPRHNRPGRHPPRPSRHRARPPRQGSDVVAALREQRQARARWPRPLPQVADKGGAGSAGQTVPSRGRLPSRRKALIAVLAQALVLRAPWAPVSVVSR